jgi:hypothetical protein
MRKRARTAAGVTCYVDCLSLITIPYELNIRSLPLELLFSCLQVRDLENTSPLQPGMTSRVQQPCDPQDSANGIPFNHLTLIGRLSLSLNCMQTDYPWLVKMWDPSNLPSTRIASSASMQSRHEDNLIPSLQLIRILALKLPVCVVDED